MAKVQSDDKFLVNRDEQSYKVNTEDLMAELKDTDLMLVQRSGQSYKVTGADVKDSVIPATPPVIGTVGLVEDDDSGARFTSESFTTTVTMDVDGEPGAALGIKAKVEAEMTGDIRTGEITGVAVGPGVQGAWQAQGRGRLPRAGRPRGPRVARGGGCRADRSHRS